jgi:hypothetical protein
MPNDSLIFCSRYLSSPEVPEASARFGILSVHLKRFLCSSTKLEEPEQHFVTFCPERRLRWSTGSYYRQLVQAYQSDLRLATRAYSSRAGPAQFGRRPESGTKLPDR